MKQFSIQINDKSNHCCLFYEPYRASLEVSHTRTQVIQTSTDRKQHSKDTLLSHGQIGQECDETTGIFVMKTITVYLAMSLHVTGSSIPQTLYSPMDKLGKNVMKPQGSPL